MIALFLFIAMAQAAPKKEPIVKVIQGKNYTHKMTAREYANAQAVERVLRRKPIQPPRSKK